MDLNYKQAPLLALMAAIVFTAAAPHANAQLLKAININGVLQCPRNGVGLPGVSLQLNCTNLLGVTTTIANGTTGVNGNINITVSNVLNALPILNGNVLPCVLVAKLPINTILCPVLNTTDAVLLAVPKVVSIVGGLLGLVVNLLASTFVILRLGVGLGV